MSRRHLEEGERIDHAIIIQICFAFHSLQNERL